MNVCKKCEKELLNGENYCGTCGCKVTANTSSNVKEGLMNLVDLLRNPITSLRECATVNVVTSGIILLFSLLYMFLVVRNAFGLLMTTSQIVETSLKLFLSFVCSIALMGLAVYLIAKFAFKKNVSYISITNMFLGADFIILVWGLIAVLINLVQVGFWITIFILIFTSIISIVLYTEGIKSVAKLNTVQTLIAYIGSSVAVSIIIYFVIKVLFM